VNVVNVTVVVSVSVKRISTPAVPSTSILQSQAPSSSTHSILEAYAGGAIHAMANKDIKSSRLVA